MSQENRAFINKLLKMWKKYNLVLEITLSILKASMWKLIIIWTFYINLVWFVVLFKHIQLMQRLLQYNPKQHITVYFSKVWSPMVTLHTVPILHFRNTECVWGREDVSHNYLMRPVIKFNDLRKLVQKKLLKWNEV